ncbi:hypothetical protein DFJ58DRAFT_841529 [Suillus subalutaceus]|uniref:uncharacterized protein n=1 Tax=Suillus subalutaceus TaxID=48586 RepID=UPI001B883FAC|nr:uncharacterized protein DFJ58DRAFT_841529 [Suillus subalutaceus]KAG1853932.1 hypothetical protein DFJ58DRAFT_841529 [Suillus subalutaceus]
MTRRDSQNFQSPCMHKTQQFFVRTSNINFFDEKVVELRLALKAGDIARVGELWSQLEDIKLLRLLSRELRGFSERAAQLCFRDNSGPWDADERKVIEGIAIAAACEGAVNALTTCMIRHIKRGNSQAALHLYRRFLAHSSYQTASEPLPSSTQEDIEDANGLALNFLGNQLSHQPNFSLVLAAIAAYTLEDSFEGVLKIMLENPVRINQSAQKEFMASFNDFLFRAKVQTLITNLSSNQDLSQNQNLYRAIIKGLNDPELYLARSIGQGKGRERKSDILHGIICWYGHPRAAEEQMSVMMWGDASKTGGTKLGFEFVSLEKAPEVVYKRQGLKVAKLSMTAFV